MGVGFENMAVARVLGMSESAKMISTYASAAKLLPGGLQVFSRCRARGPGEGRERLLSISFQLQYTGGRWTGGDSGQVPLRESTRR